METPKYHKTINGLPVYEYDVLKTTDELHGAIPCGKPGMEKKYYIPLSCLVGYLIYYYIEKQKYPNFDYAEFFKEEYLGFLSDCDIITPKVYFVFPPKKENNYRYSTGRGYLFHTEKDRQKLRMAIINKIEDTLKRKYFREEESQTAKELGFDFDK